MRQLVNVVQLYDFDLEPTSRAFEPLAVLPLTPQDCSGREHWPPGGLVQKKGLVVEPTSRAFEPLVAAPLTPQNCSGREHWPPGGLVQKKGLVVEPTSRATGSSVDFDLSLRQF